MIRKKFKLKLNFRVKAGHPSEFLKIIHYSLFHASQAVTENLFMNSIDPEIVNLPDN